MPRTLLAILLACAVAAPVCAADWPMGRHDARRSGASPQRLPARLHLQWTRDYPALQPAWPDQDRMQFDAAYDPIVTGRTLYLASSRHDCVRALDTTTGAAKWTYFADGPVRFAPVAWQAHVYFTSDDGYLYCLDGATGKLAWRFRGGPHERKILGNERLISTWPARGAPVIADDGTLYFAASIWPFMGVFVHALDARTGAVKWTNDGDGSLYMKQPHNTDAFAGVAPQGPLVVVGDKLLIPGGRSTPACLDRHTGKLLRYQLAANSKRGGGSEVVASGKLFFNGGAAFDLETQKYLADYGKQVVLAPGAAYIYSAGMCRAYDAASAEEREEEAVDAKGKRKKSARWSMPEIASCKIPPAETLIKAGARLYVGGKGFVQAIDVDLERKALTPGWQAEVEGTVVRLLAADDRLFAVTRDGRLYCFGGAAVKPAAHPRKADTVPVDPIAASRAKRVLDVTGVRAGYGVVWGVGDGRLVRALVRQSELRLIVVEPDPAKVERWRRQWTDEDLYGSRVALVAGTALTAELPPYFASLMVCADTTKLGVSAGATFLARAFASLRPYGGTFCFLEAEQGKALATRASTAKLERAAFRTVGELFLMTRAGALPGAADWTHEHADAANTRVSKDARVKAPLGILWFGGPSHDGVLPRHGHGPQPQVCEGRLIIEGMDMLRAIDIYTGRLLWEADLPGVGAFFNNVSHQPGANASGSNFVCTPDGIYVALDTACLKLDPATGKRLAEFHLPTTDGMKGAPRWGYLNVCGDFLIGGADPLFDPNRLPKQKPGETGNDKDDAPKQAKATKKAKKTKSGSSKLAKLLKALKGPGDNLSASMQLTVLDRHTGKVLWTAKARHGFRHNATCAGGGRLYTIDRITGSKLAGFLREKEEPPPARLVAFDLRTGKELWAVASGVFGTWLSWSEKHDVLVEAGRVTRDGLGDEPKGMRAYRAKDGAALWFDKSYTGPALIHGDTILQGQGACDLLTGARTMRDDPITGQRVPWTWTRNYGCNTPAASEHLLTFRSGAAGYYDYCHDGGTGNFGGFRSGCTNNLVVAGGVLTVPDYTRTCTCSYQNQASVALVPTPEAEVWTFFGSKEVKGTVRRLGLNLGAPGDRRAADGTLWLEYPSVGGASPAVSVKTTPAKVETFRRHPSQVTGSYGWVASSGAIGLQELCVTLTSKAKEPARRYTVRLYFAEPEKLRAGQRVFDVALQDRTVLREFDVVKEAGGPMRSVVREFRGIEAGSTLTVRLTPTANATLSEPLLCGVEMIAEERD